MKRVYRCANETGAICFDFFMNGSAANLCTHTCGSGKFGERVVLLCIVLYIAHGAVVLLYCLQTNSLNEIEKLQITTIYIYITMGVAIV